MEGEVTLRCRLANEVKYKYDRVNVPYSLAGFTAVVGEALVHIGRGHSGNEIGLLHGFRRVPDSRRFCDTTRLPAERNSPHCREEIKYYRGARLVTRSAIAVTSRC